MLATERLLDIEPKFGSLVDRIVPIELDGMKPEVNGQMSEVSEKPEISGQGSASKNLNLSR